jgi:adenylate cyclase
MEHRHAACLHADVSGYTRLIARDAGETVRMLTSCRRVISRIVAAHGGRVVDMAGDSLLAEFGTAASAVHCAIEVQTELGTLNAGLPPHRRMELRVGIDAGPVLVDGSRIYGHCVNVAARVQELAPPNGIRLAGSAFDLLEGSLTRRCADLGERSVKHIQKPLRIYGVGE